MPRVTAFLRFIESMRYIILLLRKKRETVTHKYDIISVSVLISSATEMKNSFLSR